MRAVFIRHGQSTGNAGVPCHDLASIELTELGWRQAREVARAWTEAPTLIVTSPYLRTRQTAEATIQRFPNVPVEVWSIEEFTYLQPSRWNGTRSSERMPHLERYWTDADPTYCDGDGAESFGTLLRRAEAALARLAALPSPASPTCSAMGSSSRRCAPSSRIQSGRPRQDAALLAEGRTACDWQRRAGTVRMVRCAMDTAFD
jgi:broad specificity phosphatase PhoE